MRGHGLRADAEMRQGQDQSGIAGPQHKLFQASIRNSRPTTQAAPSLKLRAPAPPCKRQPRDAPVPLTPCAILSDCVSLWYRT